MLPSGGANGEGSSKIVRMERSFLNISDIQDLSSLALVAFANEQFALLQINGLTSTGLIA